MADIIFISINIFSIFILSYYCNVQASQRDPRILSGYFVKIASFSNASSEDQTARIFIHNIEFGSSTRSSRMACLAQCLYDECIAISHNEYGCRFGYERNHTTSYNTVDPNTVYMKRRVALDILNNAHGINVSSCTPDSCTAQNAICQERNTSFECACPQGTMGRNCSACDLVYQVKLILIIKIVKNYV